MYNLSKRSVTLIELLVAITLIGLLILGIFSLEIYARFHLLTFDRRAKLQNEVSLALEHMSKYISQGVGNQAQIPAAQPPLELLGNGFRVRVDRNLTRIPPANPTPGNLNDDNWINYTLTGNDLVCSCSAITGASAPCFANITFSTRIIAGGFLVDLTENNTVARVSLKAVYQPTKAVSVDNPELRMRTKACCHSVSYN